MIKVSVLYHHDAEKYFDMEYFMNEHIPLAKKMLGESCKKFAVEQGLAGAQPGSPPSFLIMSHMYFNSIDEFFFAFNPNGDVLLNDIAKFTNTAYSVQVSKVLL